MPRRTDKPTTFKTWVQQTIPGASSPEMKDALAKMVPPEMKRAFAEMARRFQQPFQEEQDLPAVVSEPPSEPSTQETSPEPSTIPPAVPPGPSSTSPASAPEASTPEASTTSPSPPRSPSPASSAPTAPAPAPASAPETPLPRRGEQRDRVKRILRKRYRPDGKVRRGVSAEIMKNAVCDELAAEKKDGSAPANEEGWPDPSRDTVARAMEELGRA